MSTTSSTSRQPAYNVNASSMASLLSEVSRASGNHVRGQQASSSSSSSGTNPRKRKAGTSIFDRENRGLEARSARDRTHTLARSELSSEARRVLEAREKLEQKAKLYEKLQKGEALTGVTREQLRESLLVDFEEKAIKEAEASRHDDTSSDDDSSEDEDAGPQPDKRAKAEANAEEDELVETTDDFGRTRFVRKSELAATEAAAKRLLGAHEGGSVVYSSDISLASTDWHPASNQSTYYGDQTFFPVYEPTPEEIAARREKLQLDAPLAKHFDSKEEIRNRGAGFIQLSRDEEERKLQMEQLMSERKETERARKEREELEEQGLNDPKKKRERELEERRKLVEEKKRQVMEKRKLMEQERADKLKKAE